MKIFTYYFAFVFLALSCSCAYMRGKRQQLCPVVPEESEKSKLPAGIPLSQYESFSNVIVLMSFYKISLPGPFRPVYHVILTYIISIQVRVYSGFIKKPRWLKNDKMVSYERWALGPLAWITEMLILLPGDEGDQLPAPRTMLLYALLAAQIIFYLSAFFPSRSQNTTTASQYHEYSYFNV